MVCDSSGRVIANSDYVAPTRRAKPVLVYRLEDDKGPRLRQFMGVDFGEYFLRTARREGVGSEQPDRTAARYAATGELEDRSADNRASSTQMVRAPWRHMTAESSA